MGTRCLLSSWLCSMSSLCPHRRVCLPSRLKHRQLLLFSPCCPQGTLLTPAVPTELRSALLSVSPSAAMEVPGAVPPSLLAQRTLLPSGVSWAYELSQRTKGKLKKEREKNLLSQKRLFLLNHILKPRNIHVIETCLSYTKQQIGSEEHHGRQRGTGLPPAQSQPAARPCLQLPSSSPRSSLLVWGLLSSEVASSISQTLPSDSRCLQPALPSVPEALLGPTSPTPTS